MHRTEWIKDNLNPSWKPFSIQADRLHTEGNPKFKYFFITILESNVGIGKKVEKINSLERPS